MIRALLLVALLPFHGVALSQLPGGLTVIRNAPITHTLWSQARVYRLAPAIKLSSGTGVDGFLDQSTHPWTLRDPIPAAAFVAGLPQVGKVEPVDIGTGLPRALLVDQDGNLVQLRNAFKGKTLLLSFIFTRCTDICLTITSKYSQIQHDLDPRRFALAEISLDPPYDSPAVMRAYGEKFSREPIWTMLTGTGSTIERVLDQFGISSMQDDDNDYIHSDKLIIVAPTGKVAYVVDTGGWDPRAVISEARAVDGEASNPIERIRLSLVASVVAFCGGSQYAGVVLLETFLFIFLCVVTFVALWFIGRVIWHGGAT